MQKIFLIIVCLISFLILNAQTGWKSIFNGKDLNGWALVNGSAEYTVKDETIIGATKIGTPNSFLATQDEYADFILEMEVWLDPSINSGIQFRSQSLKDYRNGRVHGYQFELDPSDRKWSGGIYDEARREWLYPLTENEKGQNAFVNGKWNRIRLEAIGPSIRTWINGIPCANLMDDMTPKGFIALQVHSISSSKEAGKEIKWKNIRIMTDNLESNRTEQDVNIPEYSYLNNELTDSEKRKGWRLLWDGKSLNGWMPSEKNKNVSSTWIINDGVLTVVGNEPPNRVNLVTRLQFSNFELSVDFKITEKANSGIKYFVDPQYLENGESIGLEFQILDDNLHPDALDGKNGNRTVGSLYDLIRADNLSEKSRTGKRFNKNQWSRARVVVNGSYVEHWLNNVKVTEYNRHSQVFRALTEKSKYEDYNEFGQIDMGHILLQDHGGTVHFKNIKIREH